MASGEGKSASGMEGKRYRALAQATMPIESLALISTSASLGKAPTRPASLPPGNASAPGALTVAGMVVSREKSPTLLAMVATPSSVGADADRLKCWEKLAPTLGARQRGRSGQSARRASLPAR